MKITYIPRTRDLHKRKVAAYCRVSTLLEEQEDSFEFQQAYYKAFILAHEDWEFVGIYSDEKSGTKTKNRPGFMQLIRDALAGEIDYILCKSVSRFSRNTVDCQRFIQLLTGNGVNVQFEKENIDTANPASSMMFSFLSTISQGESKSISDNVKWGYKERFKKGEYNLGNNRVLGYDCVDGKLIPNKDASIVRLIFQLCLAGGSMANIAEKLKTQGVIGRNGKALTRAGVKYILTNETYVGDKLLQKRAPKDLLTKQPDKNAQFESRYLVDDHEAIIDRETWDKVQRKLGLQTDKATDCGYNAHADHSYTHSYSQTNADRVGGAGGAGHRSSFGNHTHPLFGKVICADCGSPMIRRTFLSSSKKGNRKDTYKVWTCKERYMGRKGNGCKMRHIKEEELLEAIQKMSGQHMSSQCGGNAQWDGNAQQNGNTQQLLEERFADIDYIKVSEDDVTVVWKKVAKSE